MKELQRSESYGMEGIKFAFQKASQFQKLLRFRLFAIFIVFAQSLFGQEQTYDLQ
jgi:hypothetical protein